MTSFYNNYLKNYLNTVRTEIVKRDSSKKSLLIYYADGSIARMDYLGHDYLYCTDLKEYKTYTTSLGKYCFLFGFYPSGASGHRTKEFLNKGLEPYIDAEWDGTERGLYNIGRLSYAKIIQLNSWKIPDDYPLKF